MRFGYLSRLQDDAERWVEQGILTDTAAEAILADAHSQKRGYSFTSVVIILGVICLCFAAMTFVAANWEDMPRIMRVSLLIAAMWAAYAGAVFAQARGNTIIADACVLLGSGVFGAAIMLVGQMYHLQGRAEDAVLLWAIGSFVAAAVLRSRGALWLAIILFGVWFWLDTYPNFDDRTAQVNVWYLASWLPCAGLAWWLRSRGAAHLLALGLIGWVFISFGILTARYETLTYLATLYGAFFLLLGLALLSHELGGFLRGFEAATVGYCVLAIMAMTGAWTAVTVFGGRDEKFYAAIQTVNFIPPIIVLLAVAALAALAWQRKSPLLYDLVFCTIWTAISVFLLTGFAQGLPFVAEFFALALSIWFIRMGGRQDIATVTRLGYLAFAVVMLLIYFRTAGTILGTSGFYLTAGLLLVLGAIYIPRLLRPREKNTEAAT